ncbi:WD40 repeat-like protein [Pluteus cervinus]|uniref:WD40 repeat-like protein n=1 Tax=Pluteus cervinus TaxID=181527 RepID=A0ACD3AK24_9AGAR|nr:WD40 repeat-like protein [Pluteus cervinus]
MAQNLAGEIQTGSALHGESPQLHIIALTMEHKRSFVHKFRAEICILNDTGTVKQCNSDRGAVKKGKLQWRFNVLVPIASELVFKILKCHTLTSDEVITTVSVSFTDILKYFKDNKQSAPDMGFQGPHGEKFSLKIEPGMLEQVTLPSALLEKLGSARQPIEMILGVSDQLGEINSIAKTVLGIFSKVYEQLEKQELCTQQIADLFDRIKLLEPLLVKAQRLDTFESLQKTVQDILSLIQKVLEAIYKYNSSLGFIAQLLDQHKGKPVLNVQKFSTSFKNLYDAFNTSLQIDLAYNLEQKEIKLVLDELKPNLRHPAAFCAQDTCLDIFTELDRWTKTQSEKLFWLHGVAGMGKSTIAATFSNILRADNLLGAYHICSRDTTVHQSPTQLVLNLCYQLSLVYKPFGKLVAKTIKEDSLFSPSGMPIAVLFDLLFSQLLGVLKQKESKPAPVILIIDALDECGSSGERQCIIQKLEEPNVDVQGSLLLGKLTLWSLNPSENDVNIEKFFQHQFDYNLEFRSDKNRLLEAVPALTKQAGGLFIWAKAACEYLNSGLAIAKGLKKLLQSEAHHNLHFLYEMVLSSAIPSDDIHVYQMVMGAILLAGESLREKGLAGLLSEEEELEESTVKRVVLRLKALVYVGSDQKLYIIHPSLREYLTNPQKAVNVMHLQLKFNICRLESSYELNDEVGDLKERIDKNISEELGYSSRYWMYHMVSSGEWSSSHDNILKFLERDNTMLYWVEVLSLLGCVRKTMLEMTKVIQWMKDESTYKVQLEEIRTFLDKFITPISQSACNIYISALSFVPERCWMAKQFWQNFENRVTVRNTKGQNWQEVQCYTKVLNGHKGPVESVAFSSDNRYVVSGSWDQSVRVWDAETGQQTAEFQGHTSKVTSVRFSSGNKYVVSGSEDKSVKVWDVETSQQKAEFQGHTEWVTSVGFSSDNRYVVSGSLDQSVRIWDIETGQQKAEFQGHTHWVISVGFSSDNKYVVSGSGDESIRIWDVETCEQRAELQGHTDEVASVGFSSDNKYVVSGSFDQSVRIWCVETGQQTAEFQGHTNWVTLVGFVSDDKYVVSGSEDKSVRIWDVETGQQKAEFQDQTSIMPSVGFSSDCKYVVSGSFDSSIKIWDMNTSLHNTEFQGHTEWVTSVGFSNDNKYVVSGSLDQSVRIWDVETGQQKTEFQGHAHWVISVGFSSDNKYVVSGSWDNSVRIWDVETSQQKAIFQGHTAKVVSVEFSFDNKYVVSESSGSDKTVRIWDVETAQQIAEFQDHISFVTSASSENKYIVSGSEDTSVRIQAAQQKAELQSYTNMVTSVGISSDNRYVVCGSQDGSVRIWDVETGEQKAAFQSHTEDVLSVGFSSDNKYVVSGSRDKSVRIWDLETDEQKTEFWGHAHWVTSVGFSSDNKYVVSGSADKTVRIWSVEIGDQHAESQNHMQSPTLPLYRGSSHHTTPRIHPSFHGNLNFSTLLQSDTVFSTLLPPPALESFLSSGWYYVDGKRYLWIPPLYREAIVTSQIRCFPFTAEHPTLFINLDKFVHGPNWTSIMTSV